MTSFYLVVVPAGERPNTNGALKYIQNQGLLERAIGVFTKSDEVRRHDDLRAFITGCDLEDEDDDGSITTAESLGEVKLAKGWTATMLAMPKRAVEREPGKRGTNYYTTHATERLKKQEEAEKLFFGGHAAPPIMRDLYDQGLAGTGALAAKLTREYFEYSRGEWLEKALARLLEYELELKCERALLGATDPAAKDALAAEEVSKTVDDGARLLSQRFVQEVLLEQLIDSVGAALADVEGAEVAAEELDEKLHAVRATIEAHVATAVERAANFYAMEIGEMLAAKVEVAAPAESWPHTQRVLSGRFWATADRVVRSLFGTAAAVPATGSTLHKQVVAQPLVQLGQYPAFIEAVTAVVRTECVAASRKIQAAAIAVVEQLTADASLYVRLSPAGDSLEHVYVALYENEESGESRFIEALKIAFIRYLPAPAALKRLLTAAGAEVRLSSFEEHEETVQQRRRLDERITRVRDSAKGLIEALDVDGTKPLDGAWLHALQKTHGLPMDDPILEYTPPPPSIDSLPESLQKVQKQVHPDLEMDAAVVRKLRTLFERTANTLVVAAAAARAHTGEALSPTHIATAVQVVCSGQVAEHAIIEGQKAVTKGENGQDHLMFVVEDVYKSIPHRCGTWTANYLAAVLEYLSAKVLELSGHAMKGAKGEKKAVASVIDLPDDEEDEDEEEEDDEDDDEEDKDAISQIEWSHVLLAISRDKVRSPSREKQRQSVPLLHRAH